MRDTWFFYEWRRKQRLMLDWGTTWVDYMINVPNFNYPAMCSVSHRVNDNQTNVLADLKLQGTSEWNPLFLGDRLLAEPTAQSSLFHSDASNGNEVISERKGSLIKGQCVPGGSHVSFIQDNSFESLCLSFLVLNNVFFELNAAHTYANTNLNPGLRLKGAELMINL